MQESSHLSPGEPVKNKTASLVLCLAVAGCTGAAQQSTPKPVDAYAAQTPSLIYTSQLSSPQLINGYQPAWWKEAVVYQIYPRSFADSNGDGIGDLNGITQHLDYLQQLGVNVIWLSPHYDSPNADNGYDIRDYRKVMSEFGTMKDFDRMLAAIKARHMRLIVDLVVNHTSDEHRWFVESRRSKDNPYRDYYIWRDGKPNPADPTHPLPPNNWPSYFFGSAWQWDETPKQFYLHMFAVKQPDLNWDNPKVRKEVFALMKFWLDKGVDGFRMDVIPIISKPAGLPDFTPEQLKDTARVLANGPHRDEYLQQMNREVLSKYDVMTVGEAMGITLNETPSLVDSRRHELSEIFNFDAIDITRDQSHLPRNWTLPELKAIYDKHATVLGKTDWDTIFLSNHDGPRLVSTFGDTSSEENRIRSAKLIETMLLTLRGTPYIYNGDELGMTNYPFRSVEQFNDIAVKNAYKEYVQSSKVSEADFMAYVARFSRDNSRTPMQWTADPNGGFTTASAKPWLSVNPNYTSINAAAELKNPDSIYHYTQSAIALHHANLAFTYGDYKDLDPDHPQVYLYTRTLSIPGKPVQRFVVLLNWSGKPVDYQLPTDIYPGKLLLTNVNGGAPLDGRVVKLSAWEARVYEF
jgi:oligo-1,6-glucosidase